MFQALDNKDCKGSSYLNNIYLKDLNFSSLEHAVLYVLRFCEYVARAGPGSEWQCVQWRWRVVCGPGGFLYPVCCFLLIVAWLLRALTIALHVKLMWSSGLGYCYKTVQCHAKYSV